MSEPTRIDAAGTPLTSAFGYFAIVPEDLLESDLSDRAVRLWARLYRAADKDRSARVTRRTLAGWLKVSVDTLDRAVRELELAGWLGVERDTDPKGDRSLPSLYRLTNPTGEVPHPRGKVGRTDAPQVGRMDAGQVGGTPAGQVGGTGAAQKPLEHQAVEVGPTLVPAAGATVTAAGDQVLQLPGSSPTPTPAADAPAAVWAAYQAARAEQRGATSSPGAALTPVRRELIAKRITSHGLDMVSAAVVGWRHDPWVCGDNPRARFYATLEFVLRVNKDGDNVERFAMLEADPGLRPTTEAPKGADAARAAQQAERLERVRANMAASRGLTAGQQDDPRQLGAERSTG